VGLLSSVEAFARTLRVHRKTVQRQWETAQVDADQSKLRPGSLDLLTGAVGSDDDRATLTEDELAAEEDSQIDAATAATFGPISDSSARESFAREQKLLDQMTELAEAARGLADARVKKLVEWMRQHLCPELGKPGARPRCFTILNRWKNRRISGPPSMRNAS
jgi:hypothetical protein